MERESGSQISEPSSYKFKLLHLALYIRLLSCAIALRSPASERSPDLKRHAQRVCALGRTTASHAARCASCSHACRVHNSGRKRSLTW